MLKHFDESREDLKPYRLTCELWESYLMPKPDQHNEVEINFLIEGSLTYLIHDKKIKVEKGKLVAFWAFTMGIKVKDVAKNVNLHPDYANQIFKKCLVPPFPIT